MSRRVGVAALAGLMVVFATSSALPVNLSFSVGVAPPAPVAETIPPPPTPGSVWTPGFWSWNGARFVWVPGRYVIPPFPAAVWVGGRWMHYGHRWAWRDGRWRSR